MRKPKSRTLIFRLNHTDMGPSQDTKNKISESLKDWWKSHGGGKKDEPAGGDGSSSPKSPEAQKLFGDYSAGKTALANLTKQRSDLLARSKALGRKKATKAQRAQINAQTKQITAQLKEQRKKQAETVRQANLMKRSAKIKATIAKAEQRKAQAENFVKKSQALLSATKDKDRAKRLDQYNKRVEKYRAHQDEMIAKANGRLVAAANSYLKPKSKNSSAFDFAERVECVRLMEKPFVPYRKLTEPEKRVNFTMLAEELNQSEERLRQEILQIFNGSIDQFAQTSENKLTIGDIAAIATIALLIRGVFRNLLKTAVKTAFETGKSSAVSEINKYLATVMPDNTVVDRLPADGSGPKPGAQQQVFFRKPTFIPGAAGKPFVTDEKIEMPPTSREQNAISNLEIDTTTEQVVSKIENTGKRSIAQGVAVGAATAAVISNAVKKMRKEAEDAAKIVAGSVVAKGINRGRNEVFKANIAKFSAFQRSEILDGRTCALCIAIDGKVIAPDDPMRETEQFHTYCRGIWVSIFVDEPVQPEITGIPATIKNNFDLVDGRPITNSIRQPKLPKL